uniref:Uncharacterized protein n=1 Tax=Rhizophora mucronata TaxID=61149 RepID=A0A2P2QIQ6_RHIMU
MPNPSQMPVFKFPLPHENPAFNSLLIPHGLNNSYFKILWLQVINSQVKLPTG